MAHRIKGIFENLIVAAWKHAPIPSVGRKYATILTNKRFLAAVQGIILNQNNEILLLKHTYRKIPWGVPSGWLTYEQPEEGLRREVLEETGFHIQVKKTLKASFFTNIYGVKSIDILLLGYVTSSHFIPSAEVSDYKFCRLGDWPEGMRKDQIELLHSIFDSLNPSDL